MKNLKTITIALLVVFGTTFSNAQNKKIDLTKSTINWVGKKVTGQHEGTIAFKDGTIILKGKNIEGASFIVDMTTINVTDLKAGQGKEKLEGHLNSDDFFGTSKFATAKLEFKLISNNGDGTYNVVGDLTIKDITKPISFVLKTKGNTATATLNVDRTKYDIKYGSGSFFDNLGDKAISDNFELNVSLTY
jgi:polyisoprenoid-binding protein YceI